MPKVPPTLYNHGARPVTTRQLNFSSDTDGRSSSSWVSSQVPLPSAPQPTNLPEDDYYPADAGMDIDIDENPDDQPQTIEVMPGVHVLPKPKAKRYENSVGVSLLIVAFSWLIDYSLQDVPLKTWAEHHRDDYLDECMALEGRGLHYRGCSGCKAPMPRFRCKDCMLGPLWCRTCLIERHDSSPLHNVQVRFSSHPLSLFTIRNCI